jgi:outer membrane protein OmpA-like peptidoglycan-associated protein
MNTLYEARTSTAPAPRSAPRSTPAATPTTRCVVGEQVEVLDFFLTNQSALRPFHIAEIRTLARRITASLSTPSPVTRILIVGHTDTKGAGPSNQRLGSRRAASVEVRLKSELGASAARVTITTKSRGETRPVADNAIERGRGCNRRVELFLDGVERRCSGMSVRRFFTEYDLRFEPASTRIGVPANRRMSASAKTQRQRDVGAIVPVLVARLNARAAAARNRPAPGPIPAVDAGALRRLSAAQLRLFLEAFPGFSSGRGATRFGRAFQQFANGELRTPEIQPGVGEPDGQFVFLFAEFAFLCVARNQSRPIWQRLLKPFLAGQELFMHVYRRASHRPPPVVNAPLPAPCDPPRHPLGTYSFANFNATGQSDGVRKGLLTVKYAVMLLPPALRTAARQNLLRAQCQP